MNLNTTTTPIKMICEIVVLSSVVGMDLVFHLYLVYVYYSTPR